MLAEQCIKRQVEIYSTNICYECTQKKSLLRESVVIDRECMLDAIKKKNGWMMVVQFNNDTISRQTEKCFKQNNDFYN